MQAKNIEFTNNMLLFKRVESSVFVVVVAVYNFFLVFVSFNFALTHTHHDH